VSAGKETLRRLLWAAAFAGLTLYAACGAGGLRLSFRWVYYPDLTVLYFIQGLGDPSLFPRDAVVRFLREHLQPGSREFLWFSLMRAAAFPFGLAAGLKALSIALCAFGALQARRVGRIMGGEGGATLMTALFLAVFLSTDCFFGYPRAFGAVLLCLAARFLFEERYGPLPVLFASAGLLYPAFVPPLGLLAVLAPLADREGFRRSARPAPYAAATAAAAGICVWAAFTGAARGFLSSPEEFETYKLYQGSRVPLDPRRAYDFLAYYVLNLNEHGELYPRALAALGALTAVLGAARGRALRVPRPLGLLLVACAAAGAALYPFSPATSSKLFVFAVPFALCVLACRWALDLGRPALVAWVAGAALALGAFGQARWSDMRLASGARPLFERLEAAPVSVLVAGHPDSVLVSEIPFFARRSAVVARELDELYWMAYGGPTRAARREKLLDALYTPSPAVLARYAAEEGVDYFVVEEAHYGEGFLAGLRMESSPSARSLLARLERTPSGRSALLRLARERSEFSFSDRGSTVHLVRVPRPL
jgi:hypothetical protein